MPIGRLLSVLRPHLRQSLPKVPALAGTWGFSLGILSLLGLLNAVVYLGAADSPGFPLDDAWIHQVYARNLGTFGTLAFIPGQPSAGSTAPAWSALLAIGYAIGTPPTYWAYFLGTAFSVSAALMAGQLGRRHIGRPSAGLAVGALCMLEWHMAWAALSGMEIPLFTFLTLLFFSRIETPTRPFWLGLLAGVSFWVRPEGFLLAVIYGIRLLLRHKSNVRPMVARAIPFGASFLLAVAPIVLFNLAYTGRPLPNTVYAKYVLYAHPWTPTKALAYLVDVGRFFAIGPLLLLIPFAANELFRIARRDSRALPEALIWMVGLIGLYATGLPVLYHHGRYLMPLIPWIVILGIQGLYATIDRLAQFQVFWTGYHLTLAGMVIALWLNNASTYALQVEILKQTHFEIAAWIRLNTNRDAVIATHDIGILGYETNRQIVDLAGLITPEVLPLLLDQPSLARFARSHGAGYLVVFTGYYTELLDELEATLAYAPNSDRLRRMGLEPLEVHRAGFASRRSTGDDGR